MKDTDMVALLEPMADWWKGRAIVSWKEADLSDVLGPCKWEGTWEEFVDENVDAGMEREEIKEVAGALDRGEVYMFGGGAFSVSFLKKE
jgi:hypothetical protein